MACDQWEGKLDAYLDGELDPAETSTLAVHLRGCAACAADALQRVQIKRSVQMAGRRYEASAQLRSRISQSVAAGSRAGRDNGGFAGIWKLVLVPVLVVLVAAVGLTWYQAQQAAARERVYSELADLHVATLASANPVDVLSTDRHTVKPWFQGKIPFTFNLPELQGSEFTLLGGRVGYLEQTPGAHLIFQVRKHEISVFIFPERGVEMPRMLSGPVNQLSFNVESWGHNGLRYFVVGDAAVDEIRSLSKLIWDANNPS
jgi:anti-sigma factor RsiW